MPSPRDRLLALVLFLIGSGSIAVYVVVLRTRVPLGVLVFLCLIELASLVLVYFIVTRQWRRRP
jgi:hypothetical protein